MTERLLQSCMTGRCADRRSDGLKGASVHLRFRKNSGDITVVVILLTHTVGQYIIKKCLNVI